MAENRRRFRNKKRDELRPIGNPSTPFTIARRENSSTPLVHPRILLKKEAESNAGSGSSGSNNDFPAAIKTIIINRSDGHYQRSSSERVAASSSSTTSVCAALATSPNLGNTAASGASGADVGVVPPRMTRPTPLILANGVFNANARKLFHKSNTDFTVVGVLGSKNVGKSTLLNLLTAERANDYDYYKHLIAADADECIFATRHRCKPGQAASSKQLLRTLQVFITRERYVLLDVSSPLKGSTAKEEDNMELHTLNTMMQLLTCCHVLVLAIDEINLDQLRLLHTALRLRPRALCKSYVREHQPQLLIVRTRARRQHFDPGYRERLDKQLALLFDTTGLPIYRGRGDGRTINTLMLPQLSSNAATAHHPSLPDLVRQLRERIFSMVRTSMCHSSDFTESLWFELLSETIRKCGTDSQHFEQLYAEIKLRHLELRSKLRTDANWRNKT